MPAALIDYTNQRFGKLVALRFSHRANHATYWVCRCDCDPEREIVMRIRSLVSGNTNACGKLCPLTKEGRAANARNMTSRPEFIAKRANYWRGRKRPKKFRVACEGCGRTLRSASKNRKFCKRCKKKKFGNPYILEIKRRARAHKAMLDLAETGRKLTEKQGE